MWHSEGLLQRLDLIKIGTAWFNQRISVPHHLLHIASAYTITADMWRIPISNHSFILSIWDTLRATPGGKLIRFISQTCTANAAVSSWQYTETLQCKIIYSPLWLTCFKLSHRSSPRKNPKSHMDTYPHQSHHCQ